MPAATQHSSITHHAPLKRCGEVALSLLCLLCPTLRRSPYGAGWRSVRRAERTERTVTGGSEPATARKSAPSNMGLEKEKSDTSIIMDEDEFNRSIEPILSKKKGKVSDAPDRDPNDINAHLKVGFEDVIAEPLSTHSFDRVWIGSHAAFELVKFIFYRLLSTLLAVPMAFIIGLMFGVLSCIHIWLVMPVIHSFMMLLPSVQVVWRSLTDLFVTPLFHSMGKSLSSIQVKTTEN